MHVCNFFMTFDPKVALLRHFLWLVPTWPSLPRGKGILAALAHLCAER